MQLTHEIKKSMFRKKTLFYFRDQYEFVNSKNKPCHEGNDSDHFINCYRENYFNELKQKTINVSVFTNSI